MHVHPLRPLHKRRNQRESGEGVQKKLTCLRSLLATTPKLPRHHLIHPPPASYTPTNPRQSVAPLASAPVLPFERQRPSTIVAPPPPPREGGIRSSGAFFTILMTDEVQQFGEKRIMSNEASETNQTIWPPPPPPGVVDGGGWRENTTRVEGYQKHKRGNENEDWVVRLRE